MSDSNALEPGVAEAPSKAKLVRATLAALLVAGVVLVAVVLPAEFDIDPLGTGEMLGLVVLSGSGSGGSAAGDIPLRSDGLIGHRSSYRIDHRTFELAPGEFVEYKYRLEQGRSMLYSWTASFWVRSEMHSERDGAPAGTAEFFEVLEEALQGHGSYVAPFPGIHGWYWHNESDRTVTVTIHATGFFTTSTEFRPDVAPIEYEIMGTPELGAWRPYF